MPVISGLYVHYIKSCRATPLKKAQLDERGIQHDRCWMVVDGDGKFLTQRECPGLARIDTSIDDCGLVIKHDGVELHLIWDGENGGWENGPRIPVTVFEHHGIGVDQGPTAAEFFSTLLRKKARLVWMPDDHIRTPNRLPPGIDMRVGYADGYPLLLTTTESLAELNRHIGPISMNRFRPNIVVDGCSEPWEEERWNQFVLNGVTMHGVKPCVRCVITTTDQERGVRTGKEPLKTLARIHNVEGKAVFGMNLIHGSLGTIRVGDEISNIALGPRPGI